MNEINRMRKLAGLSVLNESIENIGNNTDDLRVVANKAKQASLNGYVQHVNKRPDGSYYVDDWYDSDTTVCSYMNGKRTDNGIDEELEGSYLDALKNAAKKNSEGGYAQYVNKDSESNAGYKLSDMSDDTTICGYKDGILITGMEESTEFMDGSSDVDESAPPGMEDLVMKLKKEYPNDHSRAFATAWAIYNKKHGKNESIDEDESLNEISKDLRDRYALKSVDQHGYAEFAARKSRDPEEKEQLDKLAKKRANGLNMAYNDRREAAYNNEVDEARGKKEAIDAPFHAEEINALVPLSYEEAKPAALELIAKCSASPEKKHFLTRQIENNRKGVQGIVELLYNMLLSFEGNAVIGSKYNSRFRPMREGVFSDILDEIRAEAQKYARLVGPDVAIKIVTAKHDLDRNEQSDLYHELTGNEIEEDLNNGYEDRHEADAFGEYPGFGFPSGADSPSTKKTGPSGARQGDNPEQKKMAVTEDIHKELVYKYRAHLKESGTINLKDRLHEDPKKPLSVTLDDYSGKVNVSGDTVIYNGTIHVTGTGLGVNGDEVSLDYHVKIDASADLEWEIDISSETRETSDIAVVGKISVDFDGFAGNEVEVDGKDIGSRDPRALLDVLHRDTVKAIKDPSTYAELMKPQFDKAV